MRRTGHDKVAAVGRHVHRGSLCEPREVKRTVVTVQEEKRPRGRALCSGSPLACPTRGLLRCVWASERERELWRTRVASKHFGHHSIIVMQVEARK